MASPEVGFGPWGSSRCCPQTPGSLKAPGPAGVAPLPTPVTSLTAVFTSLGWAWPHNLQSQVPRTRWAQFLRIGLSGRRPAPLPPSCFEAAHNHPRQGCWVMWSGGFHVTRPPFFLCCPSGPQPPCLCKKHPLPRPRSSYPTFIRSSAFTLLPWISSMQKGCSRDHRDVEEGWAAGEKQGR